MADDTMQSNTGEGQGPWENLFSTVDSVTGAGRSIYGLVTGRGSPAVTSTTDSVPSSGPTPPPETTSGAGFTKYLPWVIGAAVLLAVVVWFMRK